MSKPNYKEGGLIKDKYVVYKTVLNEPGWPVGIKPVDKNAQYFVLRVDKDPNALGALGMYANMVRHDNEQLADDIEKWIVELRKLY